MRVHILLEEGRCPRPTRPPSLSKSLYTRGLQCHKSLYLDRYRPELRGRTDTGARGALEKRARGRRFRPHAVSRGRGRSLRRADQGRAAVEDPRGDRPRHEGDLRGDLLLRRRLREGGHHRPKPRLLGPVRSEELHLREGASLGRRRGPVLRPLRVRTPHPQGVSRAHQQRLRAGRGHRPGGAVRPPGHHRNREGEAGVHPRHARRDAGDAPGQDAGDRHRAPLQRPVRLRLHGLLLAARSRSIRSFPCADGGSTRGRCTGRGSSSWRMSRSIPSI